MITPIQIPKPIPFAISPLRAITKPMVTKMAAPIKPMLIIKQVFDISDTHVFPAALCNTWETIAAIATTRGGIAVASMATLRGLVGLLPGRSTHARTQIATIRGMIMIITSTSTHVMRSQTNRRQHNHFIYDVASFYN